MKVKPLDDRVLIKPTEAETKTASGIYLPDGAQEKPMYGKIISIGPGKLNDDGERTPMEVKKGDLVLYGKYTGTEVDVDGKEMIITRESEILAVLDD